MNERERYELLTTAIEISMRIAIIALAQSTATVAHLQSRGYLPKEGFDELAAQLREDMRQRVRAVFEPGEEDLLQRLRDFEGTLQ